uniref:Reverse transcriptase Ty1/copia-type domain-containing protein n=1 Tax=Solanum lycopersicum TaxID=4081 RepID=A0A3Q7GIY9_SOLLC
MGNQGSKKISSDYCVFVQQNSDDDFIILLLYGDDMLIVGKNTSKIDELKKELYVDVIGYLDNEKPTTGYLFTLLGGAISWQSKLQKCVALSTAEAEYIAATEAAKEMIWLKLAITLADSMIECRIPAELKMKGKSLVDSIQASSCKKRRIMINVHGNA